MTPTPLSAEEIERLNYIPERLRALSDLLIAHGISSAAIDTAALYWPALAAAAIRGAEIEAGRAGAERVRDHVEAVARRIFNDEWRGLKNCYDWDTAGLDDEHPGTTERYRGYADSAIAELAALRQAAQPAGRIEEYDDISEDDFAKLLEILSQDRPTRRRIISSIAPLLKRAVQDATPPASGAVDDGGAS